MNAQTEIPAMAAVPRRTPIEDQLLLCAAEALKNTLRKISAIQLIETHLVLPRRGRNAAVIAEIEVYGRPHTLRCVVKADSGLFHLKLLANREASRTEHRTTIVIAPTLPLAARALCAENGLGYLDLEGNARLNVGEVFIALRSMAPARAADVIPFLPVSVSATVPAAFAS